MSERILYKLVADGTSLENTTDEAVMASYQLKANFLEEKKVIRWRGVVWVEDNNSTDTLTLDLKIGTVALTGTDVHTSGAVDVADNDVMVWDLILDPRDVAGSTAGSIIVSGTASILGAAGTVTSRAVYAKLTSVDYTAALYLAVTGDWSVANADNEAQVQSFVVSELV